MCRALPTEALHFVLTRCQQWLREGVNAHGLAGRTAKAIAPHLGKPAMAKTMPPVFATISVAYADFQAAAWTHFWWKIFF